MRTAIERALRTPITTALAGFAAIFSVLRWYGDQDFYGLMMAPEIASEPWRALTSCLLHVDFLHLAFNLYWLLLLGGKVEGALGSWRTAVGYAVVGFASSLAEWALSSGGIGLSGIGYGLFGFLWVASRVEPRFAGAMPKRTTQLFVLWFFFCVVTTSLDLWSVGNVAHGAGAVVGGLFGLTLHRASAKRHGAHLAIAVVTALFVAGGTMFRPELNFSTPAGQAEADRGFAFLAGDDEASAREAADAYREAIAEDDGVASSWHNYGVALERLGQKDEALVAYERALALEPTHASYRGAVASWTARLAYEAQLAGDHQASIDGFRRALDIEDNRDWWTNLALVLTAAGRNEEAAEAWLRAAGP